MPFFRLIKKKLIVLERCGTIYHLNTESTEPTEQVKMEQTLFNKIKNLPLGLRAKIYIYDPTYRNHFNTNIITPWRTVQNHAKVMRDLIITMQMYWLDLDRYSTIRNFTGINVNLNFPIPTLLPTVMGGFRNGPPLREFVPLEEGEVSLLGLILLELREPIMGLGINISEQEDFDIMNMF